MYLYRSLSVSVSPCSYIFFCDFQSFFVIFCHFFFEMSAIVFASLSLFIFTIIFLSIFFMCPCLSFFNCTCPDNRSNFVYTSICIVYIRIFLLYVRLSVSTLKSVYPLSPLLYSLYMRVTWARVDLLPKVYSTGKNKGTVQMYCTT